MSNSEAYLNNLGFKVSGKWTTTVQMENMGAH